MPEDRHPQFASRGITEGIEKGGTNPPPTTAKPSTPPGTHCSDTGYEIGSTNCPNAERLQSE